jgi:hypothetical protein
MVPLFSVCSLPHEIFLTFFLIIVLVYID